MNMNFKDRKIIQYDSIEINKKALDSPKELIEAAESHYHDGIARIAEDICKNESCKVLMLAGPSSSGKTTTAHMVGKKLTELGKPSTILSMDDFYLSKDKAPIGKDGKRDYETVYSLDIDLLKSCMRDLIKTGRCMMPRYDFKTGTTSEELVKVDLPENGIAIFEGLHALNPMFSEELHGKGVLTMYISPGAIITKKGELLLSSRDYRLVRRIVRDFSFRNATPEFTMMLWDGVVEGEEKYIFPYKEASDYYLDTAHSYEPCVIAHRLKRLLNSQPKSEEYIGIFDWLKSIADSFVELDEDLVPENSLLREFIGPKNK